MNALLYISFVVLVGTVVPMYGQNKTDIPTTFSEICYLTIKKTNFEQFIKIKEAVEHEEFSRVHSAIRKMKANLKSFVLEGQNRAFELWYMGNYTDFDQQAMVAKEATLASLKSYEEKLRTRDALFYDHRLFLEQYLAFQTEAFYPEYWFMSQERYFSRNLVQRIRTLNKEEGYKLFTNSEFYFPFSIFNEMAITEESEIKDYLDVENSDLDTATFVKYSYMVLNKSTASYILQAFNLDDATQDINLDREMRALKRFLAQTKTGQIYFVARFNHLEIRRMKEIEALKKRKNKE